MDTLACIYLSVAYENPNSEPYQIRLGENFNWELPSSGWINLLSVLLALSFLSTTNEAEARVLRRGYKTSQVVSLQNSLKTADYFPGDVRSTGYYGVITECAVRSFQKAKGLRVDGIAGPQTLAALNSTTTTVSSPARGVLLRRGSRGSAVTQLQSNLKSAGYFPTSVRSTGYYGPVTERAVRRFQQAKGLRVDGVVGSNTLAALVGTPESNDGTLTATRLEPGNSGQAVVELQNRLRALGIYAGPVTGFYGTLTQAAVRDFQQARGLGVTGIADTSTLVALQGTSGDIASATPVSAPVTTVQLNVGSRGTAVTQLQNNLKAGGYFPSSVSSTGYYGKVTQAAVSRFQQARGLPVTGVADANTLVALQGTTVDTTSPGPVVTNPPALDPGILTGTRLQPDSRGAEVVELQNRLRALGFYKGPINGFYGPLTESAVRDFQVSRGLPVDGIADANTLAAVRGNSVVSSTLNRYQQDRGSVANGIANASTFTSLAPRG